jgi:flagellar FliJ protein
VKRFRFSLETLRRLRIQARRQVESELMRLRSACARISASIDRNQVELRRGPQSQNPAWAAQEQAYLTRLQGRVEDLGAELFDLRRAEAQERHKLVLARQQEEVVERLRTSQWRAWRKQLLREEQKVLDDVPSRRRKKA